MSIVQELTDATTDACHLCAYLDTQPASVQAEWAQALAMPVKAVSNTVVVAALKRRSVSISEASVRRHRRNHVSG